MKFLFSTVYINNNYLENNKLLAGNGTEVGSEK